VVEVAYFTLQQVSTTLWRQLLNGVLLLPSGEDEVMHLTTPGDAIWALLEEPLTLAELAQALSTAFNVSFETVLADIEPVIIELAESGAISKTVTPK
jgi:hypothetical protein